MIPGRGFGLPAGLNHDRLMVLDDEGRPRNAHSRGERRPENDRRVMPGALREDRGFGCDLGLAVSRFEFGLSRALAAAFARRLDGLDLDLLAGTDEAEALLMRDLEQRAHAGEARHRNRNGA